MTIWKPIAWQPATKTTFGAPVHSLAREKNADGAGQNQCNVRIDNGKTVVYATNRGQNTIVSFDATDIIAGKIDVEFPLIQRISSYGNFPRYMSLDPVGKRLIVSNKKSGSVFVYTIDQETGKLSLSQEKPTQIAWVIAAGFIPRED